MSYYEIIKTYSKGKGEAAMWDATKMVSDIIEPMKTTHPDKYWALIKSTYALLAGPHYNEEFGEWQIAQMSYKDRNGNIHHAPHWTKAQYAAAYEALRPKIKDEKYTAWDLAVTLEMLYSDYICVLRDWFPTETDQELDNRVITMALAYLNDEDDKEEGKIWRRFND